MDLCHIASCIKARTTQPIRKWHGKASNDKQEARETSQTTRKRGPSRKDTVCEEVTQELPRDYFLYDHDINDLFDHSATFMAH